MNKQQYAAFLACAVIPAVINTIAEKMKWDRMTTIQRFYHSKVYALLDTFEALHTTGLEYLMNDIHGYIAECKSER